MLLHPDDRFAVFIDGANLYATAKALDFDIDYKRLLTSFSKKGIRFSLFKDDSDSKN